MMISVCMATYNGERYIQQQLESILAQLPEAPAEAEVLIADDGSTDGTLSFVRSLSDGRVKILPASTHLGPVYNFERSLQAAKGDVIFLADQDDIWLPGKVQSMLAALGGESGNVKNFLAVHDGTFMDGEGRPLELGRMWGRRPFQQGVIRNWLRNSYTGCCMAFRRELLQKALPFPKKLPMHDQWLGLMAERYFSVVAVEKPLIRYRLHEKNATHLVGGNSSGFFQRLVWRFNLLRSLVFAGFRR